MVAGDLHPQTGAFDLVAIARTDSTFSRANFLIAFGTFAAFVQQPVVREDDMRAIADEQIRADLDPLLRRPLFSDEIDRIDDYAVANHACLARAENSGRNQMQHELVSPMTTVWPALFPPWLRTTIRLHQ